MLLGILLLWASLYFSRRGEERSSHNRDPFVQTLLHPVPPTPEPAPPDRACAITVAVRVVPASARPHWTPNIRPKGSASCWRHSGVGESTVTESRLFASV